jgi:Na+/melibiose symporter-like transporter
MLFIPYYAWAAELSPDYNERTTIAAWRMFLGMVANVATKVLPVVALLLFSYGGTKEVVEMIGWGLLFLIPVAISLTTYNVPEKRDYTSTKIPILKGLKVMWNNSPFKRLVFAFFFTSMGTALSTAVVLFYIRGVTGEEEAGIIFLLFYYTSNLCGIPFWAWFSSKIGKHNAWMIGLSFFIIMSPFYMFLGQGDFYWMLPITATTGFAGASFYVMPNSMKADVIDLDTLNSGEDRAGQFFAVWSFASKIALSFGPFLGLMILSIIGFDSTPGAINSDNQILGLKLLFSFACPICFFIVLLIVRKYPITEDVQLDIRKKLEKQKEEATKIVENPNG